MRTAVAALVATILATGCQMESDPLEVGVGVEEAVAPIQFLGGLADTLLPEPLPEDGGAYQVTDSMPSGTNLWRVPLAANLVAGACLDLSDPVAYVRAAPAASAHRHDWILFIPGGGALQDADDVLAAWFALDGGSFGEMSSRWAPPSIAPGGILDPTNADNPFADFNLVFIHKCSSDRFMGRRAGDIQTLSDDHLVDGYVLGGPAQEFGMAIGAGSTIELAFRGHDIVDAVIDTLADSTVTYDDGISLITMPSLADADSVLFIGHFGGSKGATLIIDDVAARIRAYAPSAEVRLVMDAGFMPSAESLVNGATYPATSYPTNDPANGGDPLAAAAALQDGYEGGWDADGDATCLDNEADDAVCGDVLHVLMNWVETPLYVRQDLADSVHTRGKDAAGANVPDCWQTDWDTDPGVCYGDTQAHAEAVLDQANDLALLRTRALSHTVLGTTLVRPSGFFPACGSHAGAHTDDGFYDTLTTANGLHTSYAEELWHWYQHPSIAFRAVEVTPVTGIATGCP